MHFKHAEHEQSAHIWICAEWESYVNLSLFADHISYIITVYRVENVCFIYWYITLFLNNNKLIMWVITNVTYLSFSSQLCISDPVQLAE